MDHRIVSRAEWIDARRRLLAREKELTRMRDELSRERRELPWERVEKGYVFDGPEGRESLADLFDGRSQLIVYHFMFAPDWDAGCKSCSFWADNFDRIPVHLRHRDVSFVAVARAPLARIEDYRRRMGWSFKWLSSHGNDFNFDYHASFRAEEMEKGEAEYNYRTIAPPTTDLPGVSVFYKDPRGDVFHTYSCYARGIDALNGAYQYLDLTPKGRDEGGRSQFWVRRHDEYGD